MANFTLIIPQIVMPTSAPGSLTLEWPAVLPGWVLEESPDLSAGSWVPSVATIGINGSNKQVVISAPIGDRFFRLRHP